MGESFNIFTLYVFLFPAIGPSQTSEYKPLTQSVSDDDDDDDDNVIYMDNDHKGDLTPTELYGLGIKPGHVKNSAGVRLRRVRCNCFRICCFVSVLISVFVLLGAFLLYLSKPHAHSFNGTTTDWFKSYYNYGKLWFELSATWSCVSLPRPTTSSGFKLLIFVQFGTKNLQIVMFNPFKPEFIIVIFIHYNFHSKTLGCRKIRSVIRHVRCCFNASWGLKGLNTYFSPNYCDYSVNKTDYKWLLSWLASKGLKSHMWHFVK